MKLLIAIWLALLSNTVEPLRRLADERCFAELPAVPYVGWERDYDKCMEAFGFEPWKAPVE